MKILIYIIAIAGLAVLMSGCMKDIETVLPLTNPPLLSSPTPTQRLRETKISPGSTVLPSATSTKPVTPTIEMSTPTPSPTIITISPTASPTASPTPFVGIKVSKIEISSAKPALAESDGVIALHDRGIWQEIFLELDTFNKVKIDPQNRFSYCNYVTTDRTRILCNPKGFNGIQVRDIQGVVISRKMLQNAIGPEVGWVNNEQIGFVTEPQEKDNPFDEDYPYKNMAITFYNPYDDSKITIQPDYPGIKALSTYYHLGPLAFTGVSYNPTLDLAVYSAFQDFSYIVLYDRVANQEIARIYEDDIFAYPQWSPDGDRVVVTGSNEPMGIVRDTELYMMSRENGLQQITDLGALFQEKTEIYSIGWSPDGKRIAFEFRSYNSECASSCIGILNLDTQDVVLYNFPGYIIGIVEYPVYALTWSPDGRKLLLNSNPDAREDNSIIIFDIDKQAAYEVAENARILGWMVAP